MSDYDEGKPEDHDSWSSSIHEDDLSSAISPDSDSDLESLSSSTSNTKRRKAKTAESDEEMPYEAAPRKRRPSWEPESAEVTGITRLPIKLADGRVQNSTEKVYIPRETSGPQDSEEESDDIDDDEETSGPRREDVSTGARFGRPAVVDVISNKSRKARISGAQEQIANICQEIVSDPENSVSFISEGLCE